MHYNADRYQNGTENGREAQNHLSYTVITPNQYASQSPPPAGSPRRARTPQRQGSLPEARRPEPLGLHQLTAPAPAPPDDMEPQNISFIGSAEDDALRQGIDRLNISSGTRTYRIPSPTRPSLDRNSFRRPDEPAETNEKGFYISFDNEQPKRPKPPLRAKRGSPRKERSEYTSPERSPENTWSERDDRRDERRDDRRDERRDDRREDRRDERRDDRREERDERVEERRETARMEAPRERARPPGAEPAALVIGELNPDPVSEPVVVE